MDIKHKSKVRQIEKHKQFLLNERGISLTDILSSEKCQQIIRGCREFRDRIYPPLTTLFMFIKQVLNPDKSCKRAVAGYVAEQMSEGKEISSNNTGPYCKARERLPEALVHALVKEVGGAAPKKALQGWKIYGRETKLMDGSMVMMPDTAENQNIYPQHGNQKAVAGYPLARLVVIMSLTVGTVIDYAIGAFRGKGTGEHSLLRSIFDCINAGDILLGDRYYPSFF